MRVSNTDLRVLLLAAEDNIAVASMELAAGTAVMVAGQRIVLRQAVDVGHKFACRPIASGERVRKYRAPIGHATQDIAAGEYVHTHNLASDYIPTYTFDKGKQFSEG